MAATNTINATTQGSGPSAGLVLTAEHHRSLFMLIQANDTVRVDLAWTLFAKLLPKRTAQRLQTISRVGLAWCVRLFSLSQCLAIALAFVDTAHEPLLGLVIPISCAVLAAPALVVSTGSLSLKVLYMLKDESELRCTLTLSLFQWLAIGSTFRDMRCVVCVLEWWVVQLAFSVDADFRLYTRRLHPCAVSTVVSLAYLSSSLTGLLKNSFKPILTINGQTISANDVLQWASPPLVLLLLKSIHHQRRSRRKRRINPESAKTVTVYGSLIKIRLVLMDPEEAAQLERPQKPGSPLGIPILRSNLTVKHIDPKETLIRTAFPLPDEGMGIIRLVALYTTGVVSFMASCYGAVACQVRLGAVHSSPSYTTAICIAALLGAVGFCGTSARYYNRRLLRALLRTFDVVFSSLLSSSGALLVCWMYNWDLRCINVVAWWIWFHWILLFDALTPSVRQYFSLQKITITPAVLFTLYALAGPLALLYGYTDVYLSDRELFAHIRLSTIVVSHILTLWILNMRLVWDFGVRDDGELISIMDLVEYMAPTDAVFTRSSRTTSRRSSVVSIVPTVLSTPLQLDSPSLESSQSPTSLVAPSPALGPLRESS